MKKKNRIILVCSVISIVVILFDLFIDNKNGFKLSEVYVSLAAFIMLIGTAILQNIELSMQREDLELTRKEMKEQTKEFEENNKQTKFFELLKIKEDIYMNIDSSLLNDFIREYKRNLLDELENRLSSNERLNELTSGFLNDINKYRYDLSLYREKIAAEYNLNTNELYEVKSILQEAFNYAVDDAFVEITIPNEIKKLQQFNNILEKMYVDKTIFSQLKKFKIDFFNGLPQDMNFSEMLQYYCISDEFYNYLSIFIRSLHSQFTFGL